MNGSIKNEITSKRSVSSAHFMVTATFFLYSPAKIIHSTRISQQQHQIGAGSGGSAQDHGLWVIKY
jgi:hypothetical protein